MPIIEGKQILSMSPYIGVNLPNWPSIVHYYLTKLEICTILSKNHQEGEQIIFMDIRVLLTTNYCTEPDFDDEPLFRRISAQLAVYCTFLFKEIELLHHFIGKSPRGRPNHFQWILEYSLIPIIVPNQILLMSLYFGKNLPNWPSIVHFHLRKLELCTILSENHQEEEQIIFMDSSVLLINNYRTQTDFADEPLFWRKLADLAVYSTFLF